MKNILVPTDFSEYAEKAAETAIQLAKLAGAKIHFLHILTTPVDWVKLEKSKEQLYPDTLHKIHHAESELKQLVKRAEDEKIDAKESLVFNMGREEIFYHIRNNAHDFLVIGAHGISGSQELLIGSNAQKIVRESPVPVLTIKNKAPEMPIRKIVFASTFEEDVYKPFQEITALARIMEAHIDLLYVNLPFAFEESDTSYQKMETFLKECHSEEKCSMNIFNAFNEESGILKFSHDNNIDLIALTTHGKKGFLNLMSKSILESMVNHASIPVLSVNTGNT